MQSLEEIRTRLLEMSDGDAPGNEEALHLEADQLLLDALRLVGCSEIAWAYNEAKAKVKFWYS